MEQQKFTTIQSQSRFKKYILNSPNNHSRLLQKLPSASTTLPTFDPANYSICVGQPIAITSSSRKNNNKITRAEVINRNLSKQTLKRMKRFKPSHRFSSEEKGIKKLKAHIRSIAHACNKMDKSCVQLQDGRGKEMRRKEQNRQFMMSHLSFYEIEEEKIELQKTFLSNFSHLKAPNKMVSTLTSAMSRTSSVFNANSALSLARSALPVKNGEDNLLNCFRLIDRLYKVLQDMEQLGYYRKSNKNLINFCTNTKIWLSHIFLYESSNNKDAFSIKTKWLVVPTSEQAKSKLSKFIVKGGKVELKAMVNDIQELLEHIEQSLAQKKLIEVTKIGDYIQSRLKSEQQEGKENWGMLRVAKSQRQKYDFSKDVQQLEERFGTMNAITKVSRRRFDDLNHTYQRLQSLL